MIFWIGYVYFLQSVIVFQSPKVMSVVDFIIFFFVGGGGKTAMSLNTNDIKNFMII